MLHPAVLPALEGLLPAVGAAARHGRAPVRAAAVTAAAALADAHPSLVLPHLLRCGAWRACHVRQINPSRAGLPGITSRTHGRSPHENVPWLLQVPCPHAVVGRTRLLTPQRCPAGRPARFPAGRCGCQCWSCQPHPHTVACTCHCAWTAFHPKFDQCIGGTGPYVILLCCAAERLVPYLQLLVVPLLGRMTDSLPAVRCLATPAFAAIMPLVPLAQVLSAIAPGAPAQRVFDLEADCRCSVSAQAAGQLVMRVQCWIHTWQLCAAGCGHARRAGRCTKGRMGARRCVPHTAAGFIGRGDHLRAQLQIQHHACVKQALAVEYSPCR